LDQSSLTIFRARDHPFAFTVERDTSDISSVTFESEHSGRICRSDVVELYGVMSGSGQKALVW
jgi:hypothetical protein